MNKKYFPGRRLYLDKQGCVVEANDPNRHILLCSEKGGILMSRAVELGIVDPVQVEEAQTEDVQQENKVITLGTGPVDSESNAQGASAQKSEEATGVKESTDSTSPVQTAVPAAAPTQAPVAKPKPKPKAQAKPKK
jgi:hypothetical protein